MRHHYVPQFLLRRWTDAAGKLRTYTMRSGRLTQKDMGPRYTGYENGLYALVAGMLGFPDDHLEKRLFGPIDNNAAVALDKMERRAPLTEDDHIAWTFFLCSLRVRQPDVLEFLRTEGKHHHAEILANLDKESLPAGVPSTEQWFNRHFPGAIDAATLTSWLPRMILHDDVADRFSGLHWWCREFEADAPKLLLSDLPIHWEGGFNQPGFFIQLPISPDRIFFGTASAETEQILGAMPADQLIPSVNRSTLASSSQRIWATTDGGLDTFVEANRGVIGKNVAPFRSFAPWNQEPPEGSAIF